MPTDEARLYMEQSDAFRRPISYGEIRAVDFDALLLTGGHAPGMRVYLGSGVLQSAVADFFAQERPVGAICHGVLLAARSSLHSGKSVRYGKKTTALTKQMELIAWRLTCFYLGDYYRAYQTTVEDEVRTALARPEDFIRGPLPLRRDSAATAWRGIYGVRRRLLIGGRRASPCLRIRRDDRLTAWGVGPRSVMLMIGSYSDCRIL
jgi:protease I